MKPTPTFWNLIAKKYIAGAVPDQEIYERKLAQTRDLLKPDWHLLEIGSGSGNTALTHAPHVAQVTGIDFAHKMVTHAQNQTRERGISNAQFMQMDLFDLPDAPQYDAILMMSVLHLMPDWRQALRKVYALTSDNGVFVSSTICLAEQSAILRRLAPVLSVLPVLPTLASFDQETLFSEMAATGFVIEDHWRDKQTDASFIVARKPILGEI